MKPQAERMNGGRAMPQFSLQDYFACMRAICLNEPEMLRDRTWVLPVRRFNPGSLVTRSGQSVIAQLRKISKAVVIEDLDLDPAGLRCHMEQFHLNDSAVVQFIRDGFSTEVFHYVVASRDVAAGLKGKRIW